MTGQTIRVINYIAQNIQAIQKYYKPYSGAYKYMPTSKSEKVPIPGSQRAAVSGGQHIGAADPNEVIEVTVVVRLPACSSSSTTAEKLGSQALQDRKYLSRQDFAYERGASIQDLEKVKQFAQEYGLRVIEANPARRTVKLSGCIGSFTKAFDVRLERFKDTHGEYRVQVGEIFIPKDLSEIVKSVHGLDSRHQVERRFQ
jgi:kumamolisin